MYRQFQKIAVLVVLLTVTGARVGIAQSLDPQTLRTWIAERDSGKRHFILVDVRSAYEHQQGVIPGTDTLIPYSELPKRHQELGVDPKKDTVVLYCRTGHRAGIGQRILLDLGYKYVFNGLGIMQWTSAGYPLISPQENNKEKPQKATHMQRMDDQKME